MLLTLSSGVFAKLGGFFKTNKRTGSSSDSIFQRHRMKRCHFGGTHKMFINNSKIWILQLENIVYRKCQSFSHRITRACLMSVTAAGLYCFSPLLPVSASFCQFQVSREFGASIYETWGSSSNYVQGAWGDESGLAGRYCTNPGNLWDGQGLQSTLLMNYVIWRRRYDNYKKIPDIGHSDSWGCLTYLASLISLFMFWCKWKNF